MPPALNIPFDNSYVRLPARFFVPTRPTPVSAPRLVELNTALAEELGLDPAALATPEAVEVFAGIRIPEGAMPVALAYAGHQFGQFVPQLGDGRAILLGEIVDRAGHRRDIQLKGSGRTAFSRRGDGRAAIGPVLREYLVSEAMAALGVPTTRALAAVVTGERVLRERTLPGGILTRVAASHIRIGTFQFFAARGDMDALRRLADYTLERHYPERVGAERPHAALLEAVMERQAVLVARWQLIGFIHGVMNTDNMSVAGETIDYGPCAFMDAYHPATVFSSIDASGRYAYANQPRIAHWNLARFAECLLPLISADTTAAVEEADALLRTFPQRFAAAHAAGLRAKIGLPDGDGADLSLAEDLLRLMQTDEADFTLAFRRLGAAAESADELGPVRDLFRDHPAFDAWAELWRTRLAATGRNGADIRLAMDRQNPLFIPRNHLVEWALAAAVDEADYGPFRELLEVVRQPFEVRPRFAIYAAPPPVMPDYQTFCGT